MGEAAAGGRAGRGAPSDDYTGLAHGFNELAERLGELARSLQDERGVEDTLEAIVQAAAETVPGAEEASISAVIRQREVRTLAATSELPGAVDQAQYDTGQGPCVDALYEQRSVRLSDLRSEQRWPDFAARASELGVGSMLAVQLYIEGGDLGVLNLHSRASAAFHDESEQVALLFAAHAAVAMAGAQEQAQMRTALNSRDTIGQAKGILMERYEITGEEAFRLLVVGSQRTNIKLHDIAEHLVKSRTLAALQLDDGRARPGQNAATRGQARPDKRGRAPGPPS